LNFPTGDANPGTLNESLQLQVIIDTDKLVVADNKGGVIKQVAQKEGAHDYPLLRQVMQDIKARVPDKKDVTVMARTDTSYQTLVTVMDTLRSYPTVVAGSLVQAELFPDISIADAPQG